jgi:preprotein translocase subunit SecG
MLTFITVLIAIIAIFLIIAVLIQNPKGGGIDSTFGSGANQVFGTARSADFIEKATWVLAASLLVLCLLASFFINKAGSLGPNLMTQ